MKRLLLKINWILFPFLQRLGFHVTPSHHFYASIPDIRNLPDRVWQQPTKMGGIQLREQEQLRLLSRLSQYKKEYEALPRHKQEGTSGFYVINGSFENLDAKVYYSLLRLYKPRRIIEIGAGFSTLLAATAIAKNKSDDPHYTCEFTVIEPYAPDFIKQGVREVSRLIEKPVEEVPRHLFEELQENDVLFIDSSHILKIGGDVQYEYLEILPRIKPGVLVHVHDIFLPDEYPKEWLTQFRFWTEQYLLQAFLAFNNAFEVLFMSHFLSRKHGDVVSEAFPDFEKGKTHPASFWMRRV
jgi:predicted O-methyltransferase YrrM